MRLPRLSIATVFVVALLGSSSALAAEPSPQGACLAGALQALLAPSLLNELADSEWLTVAAPTPNEQPLARNAVEDPRDLLADFALQLRDIRYRRGGRAPATGFDCSGFVHYVFAQVFGVDLPADSASQFHSGIRIARDGLRTGDLVFFRIRGKRISHVGIYLGDGRFIHAPTSGERVRVDRLSQRYWAQRFAGARRLNVLT